MCRGVDITLLLSVLSLRIGLGPQLLLPKDRLFPVTTFSPIFTQLFFTIETHLWSQGLNMWTLQNRGFFFFFFWKACSRLDGSGLQWACGIQLPVGTEEGLAAHKQEVQLLWNSLPLLSTRAAQPGRTSWKTTAHVTLLRGEVCDLLEPWCDPQCESKCRRKNGLTQTLIRR